MMPDLDFATGREEHEVLGLKWLLHPNQCIDQGIKMGAWEPQATRSFLRLIQPKMTFFDVGANIGYYSLLAARHAPNSTIHAYEPMPNAASVLRQHIELNHVYHQVTHHNRIMGETAHGFACPAFIASVPRVKEANPNPPGSPVPLTTIDHEVDRLGIPHLDFLKIDTDGDEQKILHGADQILWEHRPIVFIEVCDYTLKREFAKEPDSNLENYKPGDRARLLMNCLLQLGYLLHRESDLQETDPDEVLESFDLKISGTNIFCWYKEQVPKIGETDLI